MAAAFDWLTTATLRQRRFTLVTDQVELPTDCPQACKLHSGMQTVLRWPVDRPWPDLRIHQRFGRQAGDPSHHRPVPQREAL
jgi:hypothetical protein